jgi:hemoglobin
MKTLLRTIVLGLLIVSGGAIAGDDGEAKASLYERLGAMDGIKSIVSDTIALHVENEEIAHYFDGVDLDNLAHHVAAFFAAGTGGPADYQGRDMTSAHEGMNMTDADFDSAVADVLAAVKSNGVDDESATEVAAILESLRPAVMGAAAN